MPGKNQDGDSPTAAAALEAEGATLGRYLLGCPVAPESGRLYARAIQQGHAALDQAEVRLWARALRRPWLLACVDAALALVNPRGGIRRRLLLMLAVLEASPAHCDHFLPQPGVGRATVTVLVAGARAVLRAAVGMILLRVLR